MEFLNPSRIQADSRGPLVLLSNGRPGPVLRRKQQAQREVMGKPMSLILKSYLLPQKNKQMSGADGGSVGALTSKSALELPSRPGTSKGMEADSVAGEQRLNLPDPLASSNTLSLAKQRYASQVRQRPTTDLHTPELEK